MTITQLLCYFFLIFATGILLLTSCATQKKAVTFSYITTNSVPGKVIDKHAATQLAETAEAAKTALDNLSAIQMATHPHAKLPAPINPYTIDMAQIVSLDWTGDVETLLSHIAPINRYQLHVLGTKPIIPVFVQIHEKNVPLANIVRSIQLQLTGQHASLTIDPELKLMELIYFPN